MKQLIIYADMEGASGIFDSNRKALAHEELYPQYSLWREYGRDCITSDVLAVCNAAIDSGIDEILLYDGHFAGCREHNVKLEKLPEQVRVFDVPNRECHWDMIRAQADMNSYGIITVGQHARNGAKDAYFPHTIHTPPIEAFYINGIHVAEIGQAVMTFSGVPYIANIGCAASHEEAQELSSNVSCISVKDRKSKWEPSPEETYPIIYNGIIGAIQDYSNKTAFPLTDEYECDLVLSDGFNYEISKKCEWGGSFEKRNAHWKSKDILTALDCFWEAHNYIQKEC